MERRNFLRACAGLSGVAAGWYGLDQTVFDGLRKGPVPGSIQLDDSDWSRLRRSTDDPGTQRTADQPESEETDADEPPETPPRDGAFLVGVSPMDGLSQLAAFERWQGGKNAAVVVFVTVGLSRERIRRFVRGPMTALWRRGNVPHVIWQPYMTSVADAAPDVERRIASGEFDETLRNWREELERWAINESSSAPDRRCYLNFAPEMNGDWVPWDGSNSKTAAGDYVDMWRHTRRLLMDGPLTDSHVQWVWTVNNTSKTGTPIREYYPGDRFVDWAGLHGYNWTNWGRWKTPAEVYERMHENIRAVCDKPVVFSEYGCSSEYGGGRAVGRKAEWITSAFEYIRTNDVRMACWFNKEKETDWAIFGGSRGTETFTHDGTSYSAYDTYRKGVFDAGGLTAHPAHPRVLTDAEFRGEF